MACENCIYYSLDENDRDYCNRLKERVIDTDAYCYYFKKIPAVTRGDGFHKCANCTHFSVDEKWLLQPFDKYHCALRIEEVHPYDYCSCFEESPAHKASPKEDDGCYLTTACVAYYHKSDDCAELQALRHFRDTYLKRTEEGRKLVSNYYEIAPRIVESIEKSHNKDAYYQYIYGVITACIDLIAAGEHEAAKNRYIHMAKKLADEVL